MVTHKASRTCMTKERFDFVDITDDVQDAVTETGISTGRATVFSPTDTCPIVVNERESGLLKDIRRAVDRVMENGRSGPDQHRLQERRVPGGRGQAPTGPLAAAAPLRARRPRGAPVIVQVVGE